MKYYKIIAFCSNRVTGHFKFKDIFQIYPLDTVDAPTSDFVKYYPFVLEFRLSDNGQIELDGELKEVSNIIGELTAEVNFQNRILKLLTAFSNYRFFIPPIEPQWFVHAEGLSKDEMDNQTSAAGLNIYFYPKLKEVVPFTEFTKVDYPQIDTGEHPQCFQHIDLSGKEEVTFSHYLSTALHNYFLLSDEQQAPVDSAIELINQGVALRATTKSLSFIAFVSSIETMVAHETKDVPLEKCAACGQDKYKVMAKFRDYLFEYVADGPDAKKTINEIYGLRSKIAHTGLLLFGDGKIDWTANAEGDKHYDLHLKSSMISRLSLMNLILMRGDKEKKAGGGTV
ncbi:hypothetical protein COR50_01305 [Chitinophaga caeni]|uniref:Uncharacterized protein n=1 Tax=Chitinophaga caeni TaxID=2029983 RepID=A0A291QPP4_9BACT|nr:HEPN domain-containing protein [Chitinophaga caeni]ATL45906.1 hypothetical protein COR50_01305 [Chitinophaga caeni]